MIFSFFFIFFLVELHVSCYFLFCRSYLKMRQELIQWSVCSISYFLTHSRSNILRRISNFYSGSSTSATSPFYSKQPSPITSWPGGSVQKADTDPKNIGCSRSHYLILSFSELSVYQGSPMAFHRKTLFWLSKIVLVSSFSSTGFTCKFLILILISQLCVLSFELMLRNALKVFTYLSIIVEFLGVSSF